MSLDKKKLAVIHILKKELNLPDDVYRDTLERITGVRSSKDLTESQFQKLMHFFVRSKYYKINNNGLTIKQKLYIQHIQVELGWDDQHLNNFIHKYYKKNGLSDLDRNDASKVIESLKHIQKNREPYLPK